MSTWVSQDFSARAGVLAPSLEVICSPHHHLSGGNVAILWLTGTTAHAIRFEFSHTRVNQA